ncbi:hypothetical protein NLG97_g8845 [Lecanicillium saksenae]|uniref:Uncharacterized protein n=1 Tax=Lecanicillium saksenae TaxID=468837 RepID=A0ACC1QJ45_9HYPO|nr:hypothetical protein NLG97_g8845 [Lecanicillium saksenae]
MSKRPLPFDGAGHGEATHQPGKRQQTQDARDGQMSHTEFEALKFLADNADDLISSLQKLKQCRESINAQQTQDAALLAAREDIAGLSTRVAPQLQLLSRARVATSGALDISNPLSLNLRIPSIAYATAWRSSEMSLELPPLPPVADKKLEELAFTHPGWVPGSPPHKQYERLEWLGDAYLELIATALIDKTFLTLPSGRCSQIRERLIRNTTLASYFREYGLESRAKLPRDFLNQKTPARGSSSDKDLIKTQSDMFEAYVAAIILSDASNGIETSTKWLKALWGRSLIEDVDRAERGLSVMPRVDNSRRRQQTAKEELSSRIVVKGVTIRYEKLESKKRDRHIGQELFSVGVYLDGWGETNKLLGVGSALAIKEAGQKAAADALQNKKLMAMLEGKKKALAEAKAGAA